jgi:DNA invertase Pin-like site-specific DNA recombinase
VRSVFSERISTRVKIRPEFVKAMDLARTIKKTLPHQRVIFTVHEMKRLGRGAALFAAFAGMAQSEREYIREKSLKGQAFARERGRHGGRPKVVDDMATYARSLLAHRVPVPEIARKLVIISGKNQGKRPSVATVYGILPEDAENIE